MSVCKFRSVKSPIIPARLQTSGKSSTKRKGISFQKSRLVIRRIALPFSKVIGQVRFLAQLSDGRYFWVEYPKNDDSGKNLFAYLGTPLRMEKITLNEILSFRTPGSPVTIYTDRGTFYLPSASGTHGFGSSVPKFQEKGREKPIGLKWLVPDARDHLMINEKLSGEKPTLRFFNSFKIKIIILLLKMSRVV